MTVLPAWKTLVGIIALGIAADQLVKKIVTDTLAARAPQSFFGDLFRLEYTRNPGAFLSLGDSLPPAARFWLLMVAVGLVLLALLVYALRQPALPRLQFLGFAFILCGGFSNWLDRAFNDGYVVDFLNVGIGPVRSGIFNVADLFIDGGVVLLVWSLFRSRKQLVK